MARLPVIVACFALSACGQARTAPSTTTEDTWLGVFPAFPGARRLCSEHITANVMEIDWTAYVSTSPPAEVVAFYEKHHGDSKMERKGARFTLRASEDVDLSVHPRDDHYPTCDVEPAAGDATMIIVSRSYNRR